MYSMGTPYILPFSFSNISVFWGLTSLFFSFLYYPSGTGGASPTCMVMRSSWSTSPAFTFPVRRSRNAARLSNNPGNNPLYFCSRSYCATPFLIISCLSFSYPSIGFLALPFVAFYLKNILRLSGFSSSLSASLSAFLKSIGCIFLGLPLGPYM